MGIFFKVSFDVYVRLAVAQKSPLVAHPPKIPIFLRFSRPKGSNELYTRLCTQIEIEIQTRTYYIHKLHAIHTVHSGYV